jgi:hypothetical protein
MENIGPGDDRGVTSSGGTWYVHRRSLAICFLGNKAHEFRVEVWCCLVHESLRPSGMSEYTPGRKSGRHPAPFQRVAPFGPGKLWKLKVKVGGSDGVEMMIELGVDG